MDIKNEIIASLKKVVKELTGQDITLQLEYPVDESHGDYSTNIALTLFAQYKVSSIKYYVYKSPFDLAKAIVKILNTKYLIHNTDRIEAVAPGFINFWISKDHLTALMIYIIKVSDAYGKSESLKDKKIMVEFTDPNPFKEFHIGHLYSNTIGESLCRLLEAQGAIVKRACYQGDVGLHVAKALYGFFQLCHAEFISASKILENKILKQVQDDNLNERIKFLGEAYALGTKLYEEDEKAKKEIEQLNKKIYDKYPALMGIYEKGRQWSLEYFESIYKRLGTKFEEFYFESQMGDIGIGIVKKYLGKVFTESNGAIIFKGEKYNLHTRVFINSLGLPTYEAKDLALAPTKYKDFPYGLSIIITANEQTPYFQVVLKALSLISPELSSKTKHIGHGMVRLPTGKMSSRTGNIITGEWLLDKAKELISSQFPEMDNKTLEKVGVGAIKYALLKTGIGRDIEFNFEESISFEGNSGPYLQYTFARTQSVLAKLKVPLLGGQASSKFKVTAQSLKVKDPIEDVELLLLRTLNRFPEVVAEAGEKFAPNLLCNYLFDLAQKFNLFYQKHKILESKNEEFRILLTRAVGQVLKTGLNLLGIEAPEKM